LIGGKAGRGDGGLDLRLFLRAGSEANLHRGADDGRNRSGSGCGFEEQALAFGFAGQLLLLTFQGAADGSGGHEKAP